MEKERKVLIDIFLEINKKINLSAIRDSEGVYLKHICDSLEGNKVMVFEKGRMVADVGTGGGFPLLPLAITNAEVSFIAIDSVKKKLNAIQEISNNMNIKNIEYLRSRAEDVKQKFDVVTARAVAYIDVLLKWIVPLVKKGGYLMLYKQFIEDEFKELQYQCKKHGLELVKQHGYALFEGDISRVIYLLQKK